MILAAWDPGGVHLARTWAGGLGAVRTDRDELNHPVLARSAGAGESHFVAGDVMIVAQGARAEDVALAYRRHGILCPRTLSGDFGFALYDSRLRRLIATSSITSHRPLAYWLDARRALIASSVLALLRHPHVPRALDEVYVAHLVFGLQSMESGSTPLSGIRRLRAGEALIVADGEPNVVQVDHLRPRHSPRGEGRRISTFWEQLEAVVTRDAATRPAPCLSLSGGLDSTAIAAALLRDGRPIDAFALAAPELGSDRETRTLSILEHEWPQLRLRRIHCADAHEYPDLDEFPLRDDPQLVPLSMLPARLRLWTAAHRAGFYTILDGEGGDELFEGLQSPLDAFRRRRWLPLLRHLRARPDRRSVVWQRVLLPVLGARARRTLRSKGIQADAHLPAFAEWRAGEHPAVRIALEQRLARQVRGSKYDLIHDWLSSPMTVGTALSHDHLASAVGVRRTSPLLEREIIELVLGLPPEDTLSAGTPKPFLRAALASRIPDEVRTAVKDVHLAAELSPRIVSSTRARRLLADTRVRERLAGWLRFEKVDAMQDAAATGQLRSYEPLWALECLLTFADWYARASREYGVQ